MEYIQTEFFAIIAGVVSNFKGLNIWQQTVYIVYLLSGLFGPWQTYHQAVIYQRSDRGIGGTCIHNMIKQMLWRFAPLIYSVACFPHLVLPLFLSVGLDIYARVHVIRAAIKARDRAAAASEAKAANDEQFEGELDAA